MIAQTAIFVVFVEFCRKMSQNNTIAAFFHGGKIVFFEKSAASLKD
jgi:hypothetical protein